MRRAPATLLPAHGARLIGFVLLATLGVAEWSRMIGGLGFARALVWVAVATAAGIGIWLCERLDPRRQGVAMLGVAACALVAAVPAAGLDAELLKPRRWGELAEGLGAGGDALAVVRLPYDGADPWPGHTLALLGALLCVLAGLLAMWPRERGWERGYPFLSLIALLVMAATPVVSLGGTRPLLFGGVLAMLTAAFLWLDRLPLRPGFGVAALLGVALAGAVPLAGAADRDAPWFDYRTFAEGLGPEQPARFDWRHSYDPITWPRDRKEVLRIRTKTPQYWKAETLDEFAGDTWFDRDRGEERVPVTETEVPAVVREDWTERFRVSVRRLRTANVVAAGTILGIDAPTRPVRKTGGGDFVAPEELRRGDSYAVRAYVPRPTREQLAKSTAGEDQRQVEDLTITVGFRDDVPLERLPRAPGTEGAFGVARGAEVRFSPFATGGPPTAYYPDLGQLGDGSESLASSTYARTWRLAQRLRERARTPADYVVAVDRYLHRRGFTYSERPAPPADGVAPLDGFLFDTQEGYCQHYSGAMALLLRMGGVPARVASGFSPGGYSERRGEWIVRDTDAHSWVEAWFDDYGWVTFDPTPAATPARSQIAALPETASPEDGSDDEGADAAAADGSGAGDGPRRRRGAAPESGAQEGEEDAQDEGGAGWLALVIGLAGAGGAGGAVVALRRRGRLGGAPAATPLDRAVAELEAALRRSGRPALPGTTLAQIERRLSGSEEAVAYVRSLRASRFSAAPVRPTAAQRRAVRRELASGRGIGGRLRALWALPPRRV